MRKVELLTRIGDYVATVEIPPFPDAGMPKVVMWGARTFVCDRFYPELGEEPWPYLECFAAVSLTESPGLERWQEPVPPPPLPVDPSQRALSGRSHELLEREPDTTLKDNGQQREYVVLTDAERKKGFVRPVRRSYVHEKCETITTMSQDLAETYARDPGFYSGTFCAECKAHFPVGAAGEFVWGDSGEKVGT